MRQCKCKNCGREFQLKKIQAFCSRDCKLEFYPPATPVAPKTNTSFQQETSNDQHRNNSKNL